MKISGFSFVRNAVRLYYPISEAIRSILPIVDEFVVAVGQGDPGDTTREVIEAIGDSKVRIIDTVWEEQYCKRGAINAIQTDVAKKACSGDWLFYLQADEVVHEKHLPIIKRRCEELLDNGDIEGLLFKYRHFWGDYDHYHNSHGWYAHEVRIIRNIPEIHSFESAQSFRYFHEYFKPHQREKTRKLNVAAVDAEIFHYGWVRPPHLMQVKNRAFFSIHWGRNRANNHFDHEPPEFDFGPLDRLETYTGTHPKVMQERMEHMNWQDKLQYHGKPRPNRRLHKHERLRYRLHTWMENTVFRGEQICAFKNYNLIKHV
jgi:hypothetical protein